MRVLLCHSSEVWMFSVLHSIVLLGVTLFTSYSGIQNTSIFVACYSLQRYLGIQQIHPQHPTSVTNKCYDK